MILDASATACPSPQVQTALEKHWGRFHQQRAGPNAPPGMPFDPASLILDATYNALGNQDLLQHVDLETIVRIPVSEYT